MKNYNNNYEYKLRRMHTPTREALPATASSLPIVPDEAVPMNEAAADTMAEPILQRTVLQTPVRKWVVAKSDSSRRNHLLSDGMGYT